MNRMSLTGITRVVMIGLVFLLAMASASATPLPASPTWTQLSPSGGPPAARYGHTAVYDASGNNMIVFGGYNFSTFFNDVWVLSHANGSGGAPVWTPLSPVGEPPAGRLLHTAVYDAAGNNMIVFGGDIIGPAANDVWVLSHANGSGGTPTWIQLSPAGDPPPARYSHTALYDAVGNNMIVFGGYNGGSFFNDVWVLNHANGSGGTPTWTQFSPNGGPPSGRYGHTAVYDAVGNNMVMLGGYNGSFLNDVWVLNHANGNGGTPAWTQLTPTGAIGPRYGSHAGYDPAGNEMVVFGGYNGSTQVDDTNVLSGANGNAGTPAWTQLSPTGGPPAARYLHTAVYDEAGNNLIVFGGYNGSVLNDVWVLGNASPVVTIPVSIDIRPRIAVNAISLVHGTDIPVAILSNANFDATTQVDQTSLTFGHSGSEASFIYCNARATDVNGDGYKDLTCHFNGTQAGFVLGDTTGYLQGKTTVGNTLSGSDSVLITQ